MENDRLDYFQSLKDYTVKWCAVYDKLKVSDKEFIWADFARIDLNDSSSTTPSRRHGNLSAARPNP